MNEIKESEGIRQQLSEIREQFQEVNNSSDVRTSEDKDLIEAKRKLRILKEKQKKKARKVSTKSRKKSWK